jgi:hypothetical protein
VLRGGRFDRRGRRRGRVIPFPSPEPWDVLSDRPQHREWRARHTLGAALTVSAYGLLYLWAANGASFHSPLLFLFSALCGAAFVCLNH